MLDFMHLAMLDPHFVLGASDPLQWFDNAIDLVKQYGGRFLKFLGIASLVLSGWHIFRGISSKSNKGKSFIMFGACAIVAVILYVGGIAWIQNIGDAGYNAATKVTK